MADDRRRQRRVRLIERLRIAEQRRAAAEAQEAEAVRRRLAHLSERTEALARLYAIGQGPLHAADLRSASLLGTYLRGLGRTASAQSDRARDAADARLADLALAERRRSRAEEDRRAFERALAERRAMPDLPLARRTWHET